MPLSEWPDHFKDKPEPNGKIATAEFDETMIVKIKTDKAIGLSSDSITIDYWIPLSQITGTIPKQWDHITTIDIPQWLAEEKGLDYV